MEEFSPKRIVYVSCDPATLARDVKLLKEKGRALQNAQAADLFPRCTHVEAAVTLSRIQAVQYIADLPKDNTEEANLQICN